MNNIKKRDKYISSMGVGTNFGFNGKCYHFNKITDMEVKLNNYGTYKFYINGDFIGNIDKFGWSKLSDKFNLYLDAVKEYNNVMFEINGVYYSSLSIKNFRVLKIPELNDKGINCISFDVVFECGESDYRCHLVDNNKLNEIESKLILNTSDDSIDSIKMFLNSCFGKTGKRKIILPVPKSTGICPKIIWFDEYVDGTVALLTKVSSKNGEEL